MTSQEGLQAVLAALLLNTVPRASEIMALRIPDFWPDQAGDAPGPGVCTVDDAGPCAGAGAGYAAVACGPFRGPGRD